MGSDSKFLRDEDGNVSVRVVYANPGEVVDPDSVFTRDEDGNVAMRVTGNGGGSGDSHNKGWFATPEALREAYPTAEDGDFATVGSTDTMWLWDSDTTDWKDSGVQPTNDYEDLTNKPQINGVELSGDRTSEELGIITPKYLSVERLGAYAYKATFDVIPEYDPSVAYPVDGGCTSFVRDGKLYRNYDWKYDNTAEFMVVCKDFQGMAAIFGMNDGALDVKKIEQLPYHLVDGVNKDGIMVSAHVLYNDWTYAGAGSKNQDIMLLPYYILSNLHSITDITTVLANYVANIKIPEVLANAEYLLQFIVTDGTTTYCIMPPASATGSYMIQNITSNPKLTNFRWVSDETVVRADLQTRPTGVERWNEIATSDLEDLRFTKCYEAATRLSEFIGIDNTTKDSTDAELTAIYDLAHAEYQTRTRDGRLWQTVHSVVYGGGIKHLWCQEDFEKDYAGVSSYNDLSSKPQINGVELSGNKTSADLNIQDKISGTTGNILYIDANGDVGDTELKTSLVNVLDAETESLSGTATTQAEVNEEIVEEVVAIAADVATKTKKNVITLTGDSGTLTAEQITQVQDDTAVLEIVCDGEVFGLANKQSSLTYRTYMNIDSALSGATVKALYIQLDSGAVNYGRWSKEELPVGGVLDVTLDGTSIVEDGVAEIETSDIIKTPTTMPVLDADSWVNNEQTVNITGVTSSNVVYVSPAPTVIDEYSACGVYAFAQGEGTLSFRCTTVPENDLSVNVIIM